MLESLETKNSRKVRPLVNNEQIKPVAVIGAGSFGTVISWMLKNAGYPVRLWAFAKEDAEGINTTGFNPSVLKDCDISGVKATTSISDAVEGCQSVVLVTPSFAIQTAAEELSVALDKNTPVVILTKGIDASGGKILLDSVADKIGNRKRVAVLSGPNHAEELSKGRFAAATVACTDISVAQYFQNLLSNSFFRVYVSDDPIGVSLCGAAKNVIAIACGIARGAGFGDNTVSVIITRGLAEIVRLVEACGGRIETCLGLAGVGDLNTTCNSPHSRNGMYGETFAKEGISVKDYESQRHMVVEGAYAINPLLALAKNKGVELPITAMVKKLLDGEETVENAAKTLMSRDLAFERRK